MAPAEPTRYDQLEAYLRALACASRLELLHALRIARSLQDLRLSPRQVQQGENAGRTISRQAVQAHLDKLVEVGVVIAREADAEGKRGKEYVASPQRIYQ